MSLDGETNGRASALPFFVQVLADLLTDAELTRKSVHDLMWQALIPVGTFTYQIFGHELGQQHLLRGESRVCPACLREDFASQLNPEAMVGAYGRTLWAISAVRVFGRAATLVATFVATMVCSLC